MATRDRDKAGQGRRGGEEDENFLSRWSQRKLAAEAEAVQEDETPRDSDAAQADSGKIDPADLPDIDSLDSNSDFTVFLKEGVPDALRRRALRKLWRLDPVFGHLDGLNDYDLDYTNAATVVEGLKTVYQVGKGMVTGDPEGEDKEKEQVEDGAAEAPPEAVAEASAGDAPAQLEGPEEAPAEAADPLAGEAGAAGSTVRRSRSRNPGDPLVSPAPTPRRQATRGPQRSASQRRWGDAES